MIGRIFNDNTEAVMNDDGIWESKIPMLAETLNRAYGIDQYRESDGAPGWKLIHAAAKALDMKKELAPRKPSPFYDQPESRFTWDDDGIRIVEPEE